MQRLDEVEHVTVETYERAKTGMGSGEHHWNPDSRETADYSIPYVVAAALMDRTVTPRQFDTSHLTSPVLRGLLRKIEVVANEEFTRDYEKVPVVHRTRVSIRLRGGQSVSREAGGDQGNLSPPKSDAQISAKFLGTAGEFLATAQARSVLDRLSALEKIEGVAEIPASFVKR